MTTALIGSPYQLLGLAEAAAAGVVDRPAVLYLGEVEEIAAVIGAFGDLFGDVRGAEPVAIARAATRGGPLVLGDLHSRVGQTILLEPTVSEVVVLEDGAGTHRALRAVAGGAVIPRRAHHDRSSWARRAVATSKLMRLAARGRVTIVAGAAMTTDVSDRLQQLGFGVFEHEFVRTRRTTVDLEGGRRVRRLVLGSALAADGLVDALAYERWVSDQLADDRTWFLPHRREPGRVERTVPVSGLPAELVVQAIPALTEVVTLPSTVALSLPRCTSPQVDVRVVPVPRAWWRLEGPAPRLLADWIVSTAVERAAGRVTSAARGVPGAAIGAGQPAPASSPPST